MFWKQLTYCVAQFAFGYLYTRAVCKVLGLTLLVRVGTLWRWDDGLSFEVPPWQAMHFLQLSTHFSKTCCRPLITSKFLASELHFHCWKSPEIAWGEIWTIWWCSNGVTPIHSFQVEHRIQFKSRPTHAISGLFQPWKWSSEARNSSGSGQGPVVGYCEHRNKSSGSIKGEEFSWSAE
jgi:hypothetical protein